VDNVTLPDVRADGASMSQAVRMVDSLVLGLQGNTTSTSFPKTLKRGCARPGGDNAPRIPIPWPQDFIIGQGRKPRLLFDELDINSSKVLFPSLSVRWTFLECELCVLRVWHYFIAAGGLDSDLGRLSAHG
jgi:hypothetical protein